MFLQVARTKLHFAIRIFVLFDKSLNHNLHILTRDNSSTQIIFFIIYDFSIWNVAILKVNCEQLFVCVSEFVGTESRARNSCSMWLHRMPKQNWNDQIEQTHDWMRWMKLNRNATQYTNARIASYPILQGSIESKHLLTAPPHTFNSARTHPQRRLNHRFFCCFEKCSNA